MTLDMANFSIGVIKSDIVACSVEYEKNQFKHMLETNPGKSLIEFMWSFAKYNQTKMIIT